MRDLLVGATRFNELARGLPGMSRGLLSKRLGQLERYGLVEHVGDRYLPTMACEELRPLVFGLAEWGGRWAFGEPRPDELDPMVLMWWIRGRIDPEPFGDRRVVLSVHLPGARRSRFWFVIQPHDVSLCFTHPGFDIDASIVSPLGVLYQVWNGVIELLVAAREEMLALDGSRDVLAVLPQALQFSPVAPYVRRARHAR